MDYIPTSLYKYVSYFLIMLPVLSFLQHYPGIIRFLTNRYSLRTLDEVDYISFEKVATEIGVLTKYKNDPTDLDNKAWLSLFIEVYCKGVLDSSKARYKPTILRLIDSGNHIWEWASPEEIMLEKKVDFYRHFLYVPLHDYLQTEYTSSLQDLTSSPTSHEKIAATHSLGLKLLDAASEYNVTLENFDESSIAKDIMHATAIQRVEVLVYLQNTQLINENEHNRFLANLESFRRFG